MKHLLPYGSNSYSMISFFMKGISNSKTSKVLGCLLFLNLSFFGYGQTTFNYSGNLQTFTVPAGVTAVNITALGAQGGSVSNSCSASGGLGSSMSGDFTVTPGEILTILVGQQGFSNGSDAGGGGGSFVVNNSNTPLIIAGGGGGATNNIGGCGSNLNGVNASTSTSGTASGNGLVAGGINGNGGGASGGSGGGGGGFLTDGVAGMGLANNNGKSYLNGGVGGTGNNNDGGGYGGGGAGWFTGGNGGGGGGYSGGGTSGSQPFSGGGGGGSFNSGTNQANTAGANSGNGQVTITVLNASPVITCPGNFNISNDLGICGAVVNYTVTATDLEDGPLTPIQTAGLTSGSEFPVGTTTNTFEVTDSDGNTSTCSFEVTVNDTEAPIVECQDITVELDANGQATITADQLVMGAQSYIYALNPFSSANNLARYTYDVSTGNLTVDNTYSGNTNMQTGVAFDYDPASGNYYVLNRASSLSQFYSFDIDTNTLTFIDNLTSVNGNNNAQAMVFDNAGNLYVIFQNGELNRYDIATNTMFAFATLPGGLGGVGLEFDEDANRLIHASGSGVTTLMGIDLATATVTTMFSFNTPCGTTQAMAYVGNNTIVGSSTFGCDVIYSVDLITEAVTTLAAPTGTFSSIKDFAFVSQGPSDNCGIDTISISPSSFTCADIGPNTVTVTVTDVNGNVAMCTSTVTVEDNIAPVAVCQNITVELDGSGNATVLAGDIDGGSTDICGVDTFMFAQTFTAFAEVNEGENLTITLPPGNVVSSVDFASYGTPNGSNGNYTIGTCHATNSQTIVEGYALGNNTFTVPADNAVFGDPCGGTPKRLYVTVSYFTESNSIDFGCANIGANDVILLVTDVNGNSSTCTAVVTVEDNEAPIITCVPNAIRNTDLGVCEYTVVGTELDATFTDNCTSGTITNDLNGTATLAGEILPKGNTTVIWTVDDGNGQTATCTTVITIEDNEVPVITCVANATRDTDPGLCEYTVVGSEFDAIFTDNCTDGSITNDYNGTATLAGEVLPTGDITVIWTVNDGNGQTATCTSVITIEDNEAPIMACPADINVNTDAGDCFATVSFASALALDNCGVDTVVQTAGLPSGSQFPVGVTTIEFTATDINGNISTCSFDITVTDNQAPIAVCQNITIQLDEFGNASITASDVDGGSTDECGVASTTIDVDTFDCSNVGDNNVILTVTDVNGNSTICTAIVTVEDVTAPVVACQNITLELDTTTGTVTILGTDIDNGSTDACGIASYDLDIDTFDCSNIGDNTVVLTVTDVNGNTASCTAIVTIEDNTSPVLVCQDFTIEIGADGTATLDPSDVIASNDDACGIFTTAVDITEFSCADIGTPVTVQVFSQDNNGNLSTCTATVTAVDLLAPVITCPANQTVDPGANNIFYILPDYFATGEATAIDNCTTPVTVTTQDPAVGTPLSDGVYTITLTATDEYGNTSTCEFELTVESVLGIGDNNESLGTITMYPNPTKDNVTIRNPRGLDLERADIYDLTGRLVQSFNLKGMATAKTLNVDNLAAATYVVIIKGKNGQITKRLLKE